MRSRDLLKCLALGLLTCSLLGCGPRETPEQHLAKLRRAHDIVPTGAATIRDADDNPRMVVDLRVTNQSAEPLGHLTILVRVEGIDGSEKLSHQATLDLTKTRPGVGVQLAALIDGFELAEDDTVTVEVENGLSDEELRALPEFADLPQ